ncbi:MAG: polyhydroxyalkanoate synthesis regulator DNA-binding domain-containing protein [Terriglobales bacterium]
MKPATVVIKKYGNRRLYDTAGSRYVNLEVLPDSFAKARSSR